MVPFEISKFEDQSPLLIRVALEKSSKGRERAGSQKCDMLYFMDPALLRKDEVVLTFVEARLGSNPILLQTGLGREFI
jgi:hypothetical protein